jgi:hypothetical protein
MMDQVPISCISISSEKFWDFCPKSSESCGIFVRKVLEFCSKSSEFCSKSSEFCPKRFGIFVRKVFVPIKK